MAKLTVPMELMNKTAQPNNARLMSFNVPVDTVYPKALFVTRKMTVRIAQMRFLAQKPPAAPCPSSATTQCVCRSCGAATETGTVPTGLMSGRRTVLDGSRTRQRCPAAQMSSSVQMGSVSKAGGGVTEAMTARMDQTKSTALILLVVQMSSSVMMATVFPEVASVIKKMTAGTTVMRSAVI